MMDTNGLNMKEVNISEFPTLLLNGLSGKVEISLFKINHSQLPITATFEGYRYYSATTKKSIHAWAEMALN
jgi:hypothetical protein